MSYKESRCHPAAQCGWLNPDHSFTVQHDIAFQETVSAIHQGDVYGLKNSLRSAVSPKSGVLRWNPASCLHAAMYTFEILAGASRTKTASASPRSTSATVCWREGHLYRRCHLCVSLRWLRTFRRDDRWLTSVFCKRCFGEGHCGLLAKWGMIPLSHKSRLPWSIPLHEITVFYAGQNVLRTLMQVCTDARGFEVARMFGGAVATFLHDISLPAGLI